ncbi:DUF3102 domain-containing protein [Paenibacillus tyrfis]|uniref:DUF3102 domain-containing protein n=1 Tax=Paenibacillus tyrfis TaxID=1501230 RepID=UPI000691DBA6|nr:DUF3102 domain-containing protein [Paenibacillus tyrfis]
MTTKQKQELAPALPVVETSIALRTPEVIAAEIRSIDDQARQYVLRSAIEIGNRLHEAKALVAHGEWAKWLSENVNYSQSSANNFMKVASEYANSQALASLSYSQALALLSVPAEEREKFVEENNASEMSSRELVAAIKEKKELEKRIAEEQERVKAAEEQAAAAKAARELVSKNLDEANAEKRAMDDRLAAMQAELEKAQKAGDNKEMSKLKTELRKAEKSKSEQETKVAELQRQLEAAKAEAEREAVQRLQQREQELIEQAAKDKQSMQEQLDKLNQQLARSNNEQFLKAKIQIEQIVKDGDSLVKAIAAVKEQSEQDKLKAAAAKVVDQLRSLL